MVALDGSGITLNLKNSLFKYLKCEHTSEHY